MVHKYRIVPVSTSVHSDLSPALVASLAENQLALLIAPYVYNASVCVVILTDVAMS